MIKIERLSDGVDDEVDRLAKGLGISDLLKLETVLATQFRATQAGVHKITGSLLLSGKVDSNATETSWEGSVTYGGESSGIHNPVDYAEYERARGADHDFLEPAIALEGAYEAVIRDFLGG